MSHMELLDGVHALQRAAMTKDVAAVHGELCRLRAALVAHVTGEQEAIVDLPTTAQRVVLRGQQRLLGRIDQLLSSTEDDDGRCECLVRSAELARELTRQVRLETNLLGRARAIDSM